MCAVLKNESSDRKHRGLSTGRVSRAVDEFDWQLLWYDEHQAWGEEEVRLMLDLDNEDIWCRKGSVEGREEEYRRYTIISLSDYMRYCGYDDAIGDDGRRPVIDCQTVTDVANRILAEYRECEAGVPEAYRRFIVRP